MTNSLNASSFTFSFEFYQKEFENILSSITICYKMMVKDKVHVPSNDEEGIRDILYNNYLNKNEIRNQIKLNYNIDCEPTEYLKGKPSGFVDLKIFSINSLTDTAAYYIIECKRMDNQNLNGMTGLNAEYIKNGIMRFVNNQYSANKKINGMIGFIIERMDISANILNINELLKNKFLNANTVTILTPLTFIKDFKYQYFSRHKDNIKNEIKLYHLMFDFSENIIKKK